MRTAKTLTPSVFLLAALAFGCELDPNVDLEADPDGWRALVEESEGEAPDLETTKLILDGLAMEAQASIFARRLGAALRSPFPGNTESRLYNCPADPSADACTTTAQCKANNRLNECYIPPGQSQGKCGHHRPWGGDWAIDLFAADGDSCGEDAYLRLSPSALPGGLPPDSVRVQPEAPTNACANGGFAKGGYDQRFQVYASYDDVEYHLGWVLYAHLDEPVYDGSTVADLDPSNLYVGKIWEPTGPLCQHADSASCVADAGCLWYEPSEADKAIKIDAAIEFAEAQKAVEQQAGYCYNPCWQGCHLHMELSNTLANTESCWQNMCEDAGLANPPAWGEDSVIGFVGGADQGDLCERFDDSESMACGVWDHDLAGCNAHGHGTTQDCAYYTTTDKCRPRGTSNCQAGIDWQCGAPESEPCSNFDGNVGACDVHGYADPNKQDDTQDCAYYFLSQRCMARGTSNCVADCDNCIGSGCAHCSQTHCASTNPSL